MRQRLKAHVLRVQTGGKSGSLCEDESLALPTHSTIRSSKSSKSNRSKSTTTIENLGNASDHPVWIKKCLKCGRQFNSLDPKRNRICDPCSASNRQYSGRNYRIIFDYKNKLSS